MASTIVSLFNPKQYVIDFDSLVSQLSNCSCNVGISAIPQIFLTPSCDGGITNISGITENIISFKSDANSFCTLPNANKIYNNDLFLYTDENNSTSYKITYEQLKRKLLNDLSIALHPGSMAYEDKWEYSKISHNHNGMYTKIQFVPNPLAVQNNSNQINSFGKVFISTDTSSDSLYDRDNMSIQSSYIAVQPLTLKSFPRPQIGTLKFIGMPTMQKLISTYSLSIDEDSLQVDMYDQLMNIRDDYDGWVFPNGSTIINVNNQLSDAAAVYASSPDADSFVVPNLSSFFKANPMSLAQTCAFHSYHYEILKHTHKILSSNIQCDISIDLANSGLSTTSFNGKNVNIHQGKLLSNSKTRVITVDLDLNLNNSFINGLSTMSTSYNNDKIPAPEHYMLPVMIYIGGEKDSYYL